MITFYPTVSLTEFGEFVRIPRALFPASSWARVEVKRFERVRRRIPVPYISDEIVERAADCGGFVATKVWRDYRYTLEQYVTWLQQIHPQWAACMDFCCEDEITSGRPGVVRERQELTTGMAHRIWDEYRDAPWAWVPTIQGWTVADYQRHVQDMKPLIYEMMACYGTHSAFRVGIGTLCARASANMIREVVWNVARELPGVPLHLWGIKLNVLQSPIHLPQQVASVDSAAWNGLFGRGHEMRKQSGMTQNQYRYKVALPAYEAKIHAALQQPKQHHLLEEAL